MSKSLVGRLGPCAFKHFMTSISSGQTRLFASSSGTSHFVDLLQRVRDGTLNVAEASKLIEGLSSNKNNDQVLETFANLDHDRSTRTGFPEAVFAEGKTPAQVASILDDMARSVNAAARLYTSTVQHSGGSTILATR
jgi:hypothetical protein